MAAGDEPALSRALALIEQEIRVAMSLTGCKTPKDIDRSALVSADV